MIYLDTAMRRKIYRQLMMTALLLSSANLTQANNDESLGFDLEELKSLSLEDLVNIEVSIASKTSTKISDTASAVYVITADDIERSVATSIPELLRSVPGLHVAKMNSNSWAVGARGFGGQLSNSLLVLMDGRSLYTPLFGGVFWDTQDTVLEDIERIEIIRGPGGSVWGSNAVNGVINIITKDASQTEGQLVSGGTGTYESGFLSVRHGAKIDDKTSYRLYAKQHRRDNLEYQDNVSAEDDWQDSRAGFRIDSTLSGGHSVSIHGDTYRGKAAGVAYIPPISLPLPDALTPSMNRIKFSGDNLVLRWQLDGENQSSKSLQLFYDHTYRDEFLVTEDRTTIDVEYQQNLQWGHQMTTFGAGYRKTEDSITNTPSAMFDPTQASDETWNAFVQNRSTDLIENLDLIVGLKVEGNDRMQSDYELQPSIRFNYRISERSSSWAALSKAVRSPTRAEQDATLTILIPANTEILGQSLNQPTVVTLTSSNYDVEELTSLEAGFRTNLENNMRLDIAAFYNNFTGLAGGLAAGPPVLNPGPPAQYAISVGLVNATDFKTSGMEVSLWWHPSKKWRGRLNYSYVSNDSSAGFITVPTVEHQLNLNLSGTLTDDLVVNIDTRWIGAPAGLIMDDYLTADIKAIWTLSPSLNVSLAGRNLLGKHLEYSASTPSTRNTEIDRDFYIKIDWSL